jgi:hypothetical protein
VTGPAPPVGPFEPSTRGGVERFRSGWNLMTVHPPESYPGLEVVRPGTAWLEWVILGHVGQTLVARGGEEIYGYVTSSGVRAEGFSLRAGDRATIVRAGLPAELVEWCVERARRRLSAAPPLAGSGSAPPGAGSGTRRRSR